jgi:hypothetical protein
MIKIIDSKRYNTATATACGRHHAPDADGIHSTITTLYRTTKGAYFLHLDPSRDDAQRGLLPQLTPITSDEAKEFAMDHDLILALEKYFGDTIEDA